MSTQKQIAANRANAQLSTGPRSEAGKSASSQNAARHSLTSKNLIIVLGQEQAFADLHQGLRSKLLPEGPLEELIFKRVVESAWNLERCRKAEFDLTLKINKPGQDHLASNSYQECCAPIHRYARESENSMYKAMRELGKLQVERRLRDEVCALSPSRPPPPKLSPRSAPSARS